jgi:DNA-directed RNA polymerase subunit RPC12/RpoP
MAEREPTGFDYGSPERESAAQARAMAATNNNVLEGIKCPTCGSEEAFRIQVTTWITYVDEGEAFLQDKGSDQEWDDESGIACCACGHDGMIFEFRSLS